MFNSDKNNYPPENPEDSNKIDPISALYVDKTPEDLKADERIVEFFVYLLDERTLEELFL